MAESYHNIESQIQDALFALERGNMSNLSVTSWQFNVPCSCLHHCFHGQSANQIFLATTDISHLLKSLLSVTILISLIVWNFLRSESFCMMQQITYLQRLEYLI